MPTYIVKEDVHLSRLGDAQYESERGMNFKAGRVTAKEGTKDEAALEKLVQIGLAEVASKKES